jgi:hypothetical protein
MLTAVRQAKFAAGQFQRALRAFAFYTPQLESLRDRILKIRF